MGFVPNHDHFAVCLSSEFARLAKPTLRSSPAHALLEPSSGQSCGCDGCFGLRMSRVSEYVRARTFRLSTSALLRRKLNLQKPA